MFKKWWAQVKYEYFIDFYEKKMYYYLGDEYFMYDCGTDDSLKILNEDVIKIYAEVYLDTLGTF